MIPALASSSPGGCASPSSTPGVDSAVEDFPPVEACVVEIVDIANKIEKVMKTFALSQHAIPKDRKIVLFIEDGSIPIRIFTLAFARTIEKEESVEWSKEVTLLHVDNHTDAISVLNEFMSQTVLIIADCEYPTFKHGNVVTKQGIITVEQIRRNWEKCPRIISYSTHEQNDLFELGASDKLFDDILGKNPQGAIQIIAEEVQKRRSLLA